MEGSLRFAAIDFETADTLRDSACSVGVVVVRDGAVEARVHRLIRPPRPHVLFTAIHGITWAKVAREPVFRDVWRDVAPVLEGCDFLAAHNAPFDRSVLRACCEAARIEPPAPGFVCTVRLARKAWSLDRASLPVVCDHLGLRLRHHDALSDAEACAGIVLAAARVMGTERVLAAATASARA